MRCRSLALALILLATSAYAREPKAYQSGNLLQMESVPCGAAANDSNNKKQEPRCEEYILQAEQVVYRIRPKNTKHPVLLPASERAQFRLENGKMLLRVQDFDNKEREYVVMSITPRGENSADARRVRLNHLQ